MKQLITDVIHRFGGREAGSEKEKQAQLYFKSLLEKFCDSVSLHEFEVPVKAKFESLKIFCVLFYASLVLYYFHPLAAFVLSLVNAVFYLGHFVTYYNWLDFLYAKNKSTNITGVIEPLQKAEQTVIVSGHMDSTKEFIWWYRLKYAGLVFTVLSGVLIGLFPLFCLISVVFLKEGMAAHVVWLFFVIMSPITIVMFNIHGKQVIQGAQDNLSGVAIAYAVGKHFSKKRLQKTRIRVVSFGSEEPGLRGSEAYAKKFRNELKAENALCINLDGVKDADKFHILTAESNVLAKFPTWLIEKTEKAFNDAGVRCVKKVLPIGATDATSLVRQDIPALTIIAQSTDTLDPTYHTRLDVPDCVEEKALEDAKKVVVRLIEEMDVK